MTQHTLVICGSCQRLGFRVWTVHRTFEPRTDVTEHTHIRQHTKLDLLRVVTAVARDRVSTKSEWGGHYQGIMGSHGMLEHSTKCKSCINTQRGFNQMWSSLKGCNCKYNTKTKIHSIALINLHSAMITNQITLTVIVSEKYFMNSVVTNTSFQVFKYFTSQTQYLNTI